MPIKRYLKLSYIFKIYTSHNKRVALGCKLKQKDSVLLFSKKLTIINLSLNR